MAVDPELAAQTLVLVQAQAAAREQIVTATTAPVVTLVRAMAVADWFDGAAITRLAKQLAATTRAGQRQTSTSTAAYWARLVSLLTGRRVAPARLVDPAAVRSVPVESVFGRLADQHRWLTVSRGPDASPEDRLRYAIEAHRRRIGREASTLDRSGLGVVPDGAPVTSRIGIPGDGPDPAQIAARIEQLLRERPAPTVPPPALTADEITGRIVDRAQRLVDDQLTLTMRAQIEAAAAKDPSLITFYRRVLHPELSAGGSCGLCVACSDRTYSRGNLLPVHDRCRCTVVPCLGEPGGDGDVGSALNQADLETLYQAAGGVTAGAALKRTRWRVVQHPERGPILVSGDAWISLLPQGSQAA